MDSNKVSSLGIQEFYTIIVSKILELQDQVTQPKSSLSLSTSRLKTQIAYLRGRLLHLNNLALFPSNITASHYENLNNQLDQIELNVVSLEMADQQRRGKDDPEDVNSQEPGMVGRILFLQVEKLNSLDRGPVQTPEK